MPEARAPSADPLLQPYRLKHLTLRNRFMSTAHEPAYTVDGMPAERYRLYHVEKARGGIGLTMIGGSAVVAADSPQAFGNIQLHKDEVVGHLARLAEAVHEHGAAVMIQITHLGRRTSWAKEHWLPIVAPSPVREPAHRAFPKAAEDWDLARILAAYADAAERVKAAGLDGLEFEMYGHFIDQFWSPATNKRDDEYGGSLDNRLRFGFAVMRAVRERVGPDFIVGTRMVCDEDWDRGLSRQEGLEIARRIAASGDIDFINVIRGHIDTDEALSHVIPGMGARSAPHLDFAGEVKAATAFPVFHAARIQDVATARHAVASGKLDLVGMTRAHMADPHIARKVREGREHEIRPCIGMGYCIDSIYGGEALCIHNPATGREATMPHEIVRSDGPARRVVVVGAGPAGLEAARVAAARGHQVTLLEAAAEAGGQVRLTAALKRRREIIGLIDWRVAECERHGVAMRFNTYAEAADVLAEKPDIVVVATGGLPNLSFLDAGEDLVTTSWDILSGAARPGETVLLFDDNGAHPGMTTAEFLAEAGAKLELVTPERSLAPDVGGTNFPAYFRAFSRHGVKTTLNLRLEAVRREGNGLVARLFDEYGRTHQERRVDQVVVEHGTLPLDELYFALKPASRNLGAVDHEALIAGRPQAMAANAAGGFMLFRIGDAVASRNIHAAVYDGLRFALAF
ncbi:NADH:flavin oxidoreductase [Labrys wisconsinensis]|uniref:2,4-dienoyl-CoA reductase-like NADH-dependent reductase (Old Yellow Enzyme family) n=1 Tax=Labrys wisconsinensis TaxID=425677 RepID=A0ABU0JLU0_9HYPH|nr:NADH:flavin oxidoreductase [Labrys wisconsinensis]MDQ0475267.1 2,4-dienoyl-CoA reductase-like NADH-dependent reductase (Old Yellow Enzyme family) [Labrys wisconsinensis]